MKNGEKIRKERGMDMKSFGTTFLICYVVCCVLLFFFGQFFFDNIWLLMAIPALLLAIGVGGYVENAEKIEKLEKRIEELEGRKDETEDIDG